MRRLIILLVAVIISTSTLAQKNLPKKSEVLRLMQITNAYFMARWPDVGKRIVTDRDRASNIWTRAVYYEGMMKLYAIDPNPVYLDYVMRWAEFHKWDLRDGFTYTRNADNQCAGQIYLELYDLDPQPKRMERIKASVDSMLMTDKIDDWNWIDALQMAMPVFAHLGRITGDSRYVERMHEMYLHTRNAEGGSGLFNPEDQLWWRDKDFVPPYVEPNGQDCYWSRGNGWVVAAFVRTLDLLPKGDPHRAQYETDLMNMLQALVNTRRQDGFWNVSLHDPTHYPGRETTGTSLFLYGLAWSINNGYLSKDEYLPIVLSTWSALATEAVHPTGFLGYVQGTGKEPKDGQPVTRDSMPNFEDFGLGCFLLAASEIHKLAR
jgi:rhamnogalacturonyl hydrolase YesR